MSRRIFIAGIGTGVGKSVVAAVVAQALRADYWKPIQCGNLENSDSDLVRSLLSNDESVMHPETYRFKEPISPHAASKHEGIELKLEKIIPPVTSNTLVIEGVGGLLVPLNEKNTAIDLLGQLECEILLVSKNYLGSINHTLLSIEALKARELPLRGIIFNAAPNPESEEIIVKVGGVPVVARIPEAERVTREWVTERARSVQNEVVEAWVPRLYPADLA